MRGVIGTNQRLCIVDSNLGILSHLQIEANTFITSLMWIGSTVLFSTERHLMYMTQDKHGSCHGMVFSFNNPVNSKHSVIVNAFSDRIITANLSS